MSEVNHGNDVHPSEMSNTAVDNLAQNTASSTRFNISDWALKHQTLVLYLMLVLTIAGLLSYSRLGQSEDPPFTFKVMLVRTSWPGASAQEVEQQVTDKLEKKIQEVPHLDYSSSY